MTAAEQYASRLVVPSSQQHSPMRWPSHKDHARKALAKLVGPHLPVTLKQVEKAVAKANAEHEMATSRRGRAGQTPAGAVGEPEAGPVAESGASEDDGIGLEESTDRVGDENLDEDVSDIRDELGNAAAVVGPDGAIYSEADSGL